MPIALHLHGEAFGDDGGLNVVAATATATPAARPGRWRDKAGAEQADKVGVVVQPEHEFSAGLVDARAATDHLVEDDGRFQITKENDVTNARHVHASGQQVHRGGDEPGRRGTAQVFDHAVAFGRRRALESIGLGTRATLGLAPPGIAIVQVRRHAVGMRVGGAKDDGLLLGAAGFQQVLEQVVAHRGHALGNLQLGVVVPRQIRVAYLVGLGLSPGVGAASVVVQYLLLQQADVVDADAALADVAGRQVTVFDALGQRVFIHRIAEVAQVVGGDLLIGLGHR